MGGYERQLCHWLHSQLQILLAGGVVVFDELLVMMVERSDDHPKIKWKDSLSERISSMRAQQVRTV